MDKSIVIAQFPLLASDPKFKITSPQDNNYNCLAWAYQMYKDRWMWPPIEEDGTPIPVIDGDPWWPENVGVGLNIKFLVQAFQQKGFCLCSKWEHEEGYVKVALYYNPQNEHMTHAARESRVNNCWMSKLGRNHDIHHSSPYTIEGNIYGKVYCIMRMVDK